MKKIRYFFLLIFVLTIPEWLIELTGADILVMQELKDIKKKDGEQNE